MKYEKGGLWLPPTEPLVCDDKGCIPTKYEGVYSPDTLMDIGFTYQPPKRKIPREVWDALDQCGSGFEDLLAKYERGEE